MSRFERLRRLLSPTIVTGPILEKELRVSSRRRRNYVLRFAYPVLLLAFVVLVWLDATEGLKGATQTYLVAHMGEAGIKIALTVAWFQFIAAQLVAIVLASSSVSEEIYSNTLPVLMTTPINSLQIVMGKLLSRLWQLLILLAISLPVLALVRVFGGVPWDFLLATLSITLTTVVFYAAVSLLMSVYCRRAYAAILMTLVVGAIVFLMVPLLSYYLADEVLDLSVPGMVMVSVCVFHANPYAAMAETTKQLLYPASGGIGGFGFHWPLHCLTMLAASVALVLISTVVVRRAALAQIGGVVRTRRRRGKAAAGAPPDFESSAGRVRPVGGSPILWRELRLPTFRGPVRRGLMIALMIVGLAAAYGIAIHENDMEDNETHQGFILVYTGLAALLTAVFAATTITTEKESRCWPLLLATPLSAAEIVLGKALGVVRRALPAWGLLAGHLAVFTFVGWVHPILWAHLGIIAFWLTVFLTGSGMFFSSLVRRTTTAVVLNLVLMAGLWLVVPMIVGLATELTDHQGDPPAMVFLAYTHPVVEIIVVADGTTGEKAVGENLSKLNYDWPYEDHDAAVTTLILLGSAFGYGTVGILLAVIGGARFRKRIF